MSHILYFTAEWCNPCQRTKPIAEELHNEGIISFEFIDADQKLDMLSKFEIKSIPTYILVEDGKEVKRMNGAKNRQDFLNFISKDN